jgi:hypothetical protein
MVNNIQNAKTPANTGVLALYYNILASIVVAGRTGFEPAVEVFAPTTA